MAGKVLRDARLIALTGEALRPCIEAIDRLAAPTAELRLLFTTPQLGPAAAVLAAQRSTLFRSEHAALKLRKKRKVVHLVRPGGRPHNRGSHQGE
mgnify:CR=1 FL=1